MGDAHHDAVEQFREAMRAAGISPPADVRPNAGLQRFYVEGDRRGTKNGWYVLHVDDFPAGKFGTNKRPDEEHSWSMRLDRKLSPEERDALAKRWAAQAKEREAERLRVQEEVAAIAAADWDSAKPARDDHPYLERKGVRAHGLRELEGKLLVPLRDSAGKLWSLQRIDIGGDKRFLTGGRKQACYAVVCGPKPALHTICVAEGYATAASIFEATGYPVVVAFDAGNLEPVATALRKKYADARIILCADNDLHTDGNPGVSKATEAARAARAELAVASFAIHEKGVSDFNDLAAREGLARVRALVEGARRPDDPPPPAAPAPATELVPAAEERVPGPVVEWPIRSSSRQRKPLPCEENAQALLDHFGISVRYNVIRKDLEIIVPGTQFLVDTQKNDKLSLIVSLAGRTELPRENLERFVSLIGGRNPYNPVANWIESRPWDGKSRLEDFYATVTSSDEADPVRSALKKTLLKRWLVQAVAVAFSPKAISTYGVLVFTGKQHAGKTHWFKKLTPPDLGFAKDGLTLRPDDKDSVLQAVSFWLVELGELDSTFKRSEISQLKAFITNDRDIIRPPYAKQSDEHQRRTVFFGSVNDEEFLADQTGNRRFWTIKVEKIDYSHTIDMQQLWAEVLALYRAGESYYLAHEELLALNESNKEFEITNPVEELVRARLNWETGTKRELTASEVCREIGILHPRQSDTRAVARAIREITGHGYRKTAKGKVYDVPYPRIDV